MGSIEFENALAVMNEVAKAVTGKNECIRKAFAAILAGGHILIEDVPGVGKTTLAVATATEALLKGFSVMYFSMNELAAMLELKDKIDFIKFRDKLENINLLICDDYGQEMLSDPVIIRLKEIADKI